MRVDIVTLRFDAPGGVETNVREIAGHLRASGDDARVFASDLYDEDRWERRTGYRPEVDGIPVRRFPVYRRLIPGVTLPLMPGLMSALRESHPDVIHAHSHRYGHVLQAAAVSRRTGIPFVVSTHYHPADRREPGWKRALLRSQDFLFGAGAYRDASAILVETELERRLVAEFAPRENIHVVPPGTDLAVWRTGGRTGAPPALPDEFLLYSGRLASNKGLSVLVEALARLPSDRRLPLVLLGPDWGERAKLEQLAARLQIGDAVVFLGAVDDAAVRREVYRRARLFVLPSEWEAFGLVLLEAMAAGVPCLASAVGGVPEVLEGGRSGAMAPYGDVDAWAREIDALSHDGARRAALVAAGSRRVESLTWERSAALHQAIYRAVAG